MSTPAKKAVPSLSDLTSKKKEDDRDKESLPENDKNNDGAPDKTPDLPLGPDTDKTSTTVKAENDKNQGEEKNREFDGSSERGNDGKPWTAPNVVALATNKTPAEMAAETPEETIERYNIDTTISDADNDDPQVQAYRDQKVNQVPSGTHLHPDIAKDMMNRGISEQTTDVAQVKRTITDTYDFAGDAPVNDKF